MSYIRQTWVDNSSIVDAEKLNHIEDGIYDIDNKTEIYSTTETLTNKVWIDGKPIYRKVVTGTTTGGGSTNIFSQSNFDTMINCYGWIGNNSAGYTQLSNYLNNDYNGGFFIDANAGYLQIYSLVNTFKNMPYYVVMEYTKPTE